MSVQLLPISTVVRVPVAYAEIGVGDIDEGDGALRVQLVEQLLLSCGGRLQWRATAGVRLHRDEIDVLARVPAN